MPVVTGVSGSVGLSTRRSLKFLKSLLDSLVCFSFGTTMLRAGDGVRGASCEFADANAHLDHFTVCVWGNKCKRTEACWTWGDPRRKRWADEMLRFL